MQKSELTSVLNTGLDENRITEAEYNHALHLFTLIYESHTASECGDEHAALAALINKASGTDEETLKARMRSEYEAAMAVITMDTNIAAKIRSTGILKTLQVSKPKNNFRDYGEGYFHDQYHTQQDLNNVDV